MKVIQVFVVTTGGLIVLVLLSLFAMSRRPGAGRVTGTIEIGVPPAAVMPWLTEPARLKQWVTELRVVEGDTTAAEVGRKQVWLMGGSGSEPIRVAMEMTMYAPPDSMRRHLSVAGLVEGDNLYTLTDLGGRTRLDVVGQYRHPNFMIALLEPLASPEARAKMRSELAKLGAILAQEALEGARGVEGAAGELEGGPEGAVTKPR